MISSSDPSSDTRFRLRTNGCRLLVMLFVMALLLTGCGKSQKTGTTAGQGYTPAQSTVGKSIDAGKSTECRSQLSQIRQGIELYKVNSGTEEFPASLADINLGVSAEYFSCPVSGQAYLYDPASGRIKCPTPQHGGY